MNQDMNNHRSGDREKYNPDWQITILQRYI